MFSAGSPSAVTRSIAPAFSSKEHRLAALYTEKLFSCSSSTRAFTADAGCGSSQAVRMPSSTVRRGAMASNKSAMRSSAGFSQMAGVAGAIAS